MYKASIDIGSNSTLLLVAEVVEKKLVKVLESRSLVTALGRDLDKSGVFHPESMEATLEALRLYCKVCEEYKIKPQDIIITATEASRVSKNAKEFFDLISIEMDLKFNIINGLAEAYFSTKGILMDASVNLDKLLIMDIGGASTELILVNRHNKEIEESFSMPCGSVRLKNWSDDGNGLKLLEKSVEPFVDRIEVIKQKSIICVAGTMTSVGNMLLGHKNFEEKRVHGQRLTFQDLVSLREKIKDYNDESIYREFPFLGKRSSTIKPGLNLAIYILDKMNVETIEISTYGLRYGTIVENFIEKKYLA